LPPAKKGRLNRPLRAKGALASAPDPRHIFRAWQAPRSADCARLAPSNQATGEVVVIPRLPPVVGASKPPGWNRRSPAEKVEHLLGLSLDRMAEYLSWPADGLDPYRLAAQTQVIRVVAMVAAKVGTRQFDHEAAERFRRLMERAAADEREREAMERSAARGEA
jgi:hypothetical protein